MNVCQMVGLKDYIILNKQTRLYYSYIKTYDIFQI